MVYALLGFPIDFRIFVSGINYNMIVAAMCSQFLILYQYYHECRIAVDATTWHIYQSHYPSFLQSDSSEWCYKIVGKPPSYIPPTHTPSRVQHKAAPPPLLRAPQQKKNFVRENMRLSTRVGVN